MTRDRVTYFAKSDYRGGGKPFGIKSADRSRHMYIIGKTGMGKTTLLQNMAIQDIQNGESIGFIDPHGSAVDELIDYVPKERVKDVIYFAPFDMEHPISFNIMEDVGYDKRHLVVSGLVSTFKKIWPDVWSSRMEYILSNTLFALLEYPDSTLLGVNRMLIDKEFRKKVVDNVTDPVVKSFWVDEFAKYTDRYTQEATPAIQNKIGQFVSNPLIRNIIGQPKSSFDFRKAMDEKKIILMNLSKGRMGDVNTQLIGSMLVIKTYLAAMSRADLPTSELAKVPYFYFYVDEFQSFANETFADILSESRKYKLSLVIAHQYVEQMPEEVQSAVFGNVGTMISFRIGAIDAEMLEKEFAPTIIAEDVVNLGFIQIYLKLMIDGLTSKPFSAVTLPLIERPQENFRAEVIEESRKTYAGSREEVEKAIREWAAPVEPPKKTESGERRAIPRMEGETRAPVVSREPDRERQSGSERSVSPYPHENREERRQGVDAFPRRERRVEYERPRADRPPRNERRDVRGSTERTERRRDNYALRSQGGRQVRDEAPRAHQPFKKAFQETRTPQPVQRGEIPESRPEKTISLKLLQKDDKKSNIPPESANALREALARAMKEEKDGSMPSDEKPSIKQDTVSSGEEMRKTAQGNTSSPGSEQRARDGQVAEENARTKQTIEIPEDELREMLKVDSNKH